MHEQFMLECLSLARLAKQRGDSPVGSILVRNGEIIARGIWQPINLMTYTSVFLERARGSTDKQGVTVINKTKIYNNAGDEAHTEAHEMGHFFLHGSGLNPDIEKKHTERGDI
ncbi:hypothetical protein [Chitinophaga sp. CF418]|uniref:hypothetical protein n=1 Tax=Chitinophaga sp. CF418 TaxID=1855287 RepID=UPI00091B0AEB|nr:hypothetical protein [Chitinophaga sp. CF418]SHN07650.1 hypothetical protein SAMN05216311_10538 [Chitinophaga sp. CF418]